MAPSTSSSQVETAGAPPASSAGAAGDVPGQFWAFIGDGEFRLPRCHGCGEWRWYPLPLCESCGTAGFDWQLAPTEGKVFSFTTVSHQFLPAPSGLTLPFSVALIELDEAPAIRFVSTVVSQPDSELAIGLRGRIVLERSDGKLSPTFRVSQAAGTG